MIKDDENIGCGSKPGFTGQLRGEDVILKNVKVKNVTYVKRSSEELQNLRNEFNILVRKSFLKNLGEDKSYLKEAGFSENDILKIQNGRVPDGDIYPAKH